jgi:TetR/AcrR family transcriptional repressor of nem operon
MASQRRFDLNHVLDQMVEVFWRKGYAATSIQELEAATNLNRPSLYAAFGGKEEMFLAVLRRYGDKYNAHLMAALQQPGSAREALCLYFDKLAAQLSDHHLPPGCLLANTVLEFGSAKEALGRYVREQLAMIESGFYQAIRRGQIENEFRRSLDPRVMARLLTATAEGMALLARSDFGEAALRDIARSALLALDAPGAVTSANRFEARSPEAVPLGPTGL